MRDLSSQRIGPVPPAVKDEVLNHWTNREVPGVTNRLTAFLVIFRQQSQR